MVSSYDQKAQKLTTTSGNDYFHVSVSVRTHSVCALHFWTLSVWTLDPVSAWNLSVWSLDSVPYQRPLYQDHAQIKAAVKFS